MTLLFKNIILLCALPALFWQCTNVDMQASIAPTTENIDKNTIPLDSSKIKKVHLKHTNGKTQFYGSHYDSLKHDYCKTFYLNQTIASQGAYHLGQKDGWWEYFHENGTLKTCGHYQMDKQTSTWKKFDTEGMLTLEENFLDGKLNGWRKTYVKGKLIEECEYQLDKKQGYYHFYENGILILKGNYDNDSKAGIWKTFNTEGKIIHEKKYK